MNPDTLEQLRERIVGSPRGYALRSLELREPKGERATGDGSLTFSGVAAVYGVRTVLGEVPGILRVREEIAPGALAGVMSRRPDVHFNLGHDMNRAIARVDWGEDPVEIGGMRLEEQEDGLHVFARLDPDDPDVLALAAKMKRGIVDEMSFAFHIGAEDVEERELDDGTLEIDYTITEVSDLVDVCACARGAYSTTSAELRRIVRNDEAVASVKKRHPSGGAADVTPTEGDEKEPVSTVDPLGGGYRERIRLARFTHGWKV